MTLPNNTLDDDSTVEINLWRALGIKPVALYSVIGGGHNVPHPKIKEFKLFGNTNQDFVAAEEIWSFFQDAYLQQ
ncbi:MAG: hypothetical protein JKX83_08275 [Pseudomonadales bacterium]|nr:hypothetical protein [Pseudomonadales bacterium]